MRLTIDPRSHLTEVATASDVAIDVHSIGKRYGRVAAVEDVSFQVPWGSVTALLGTGGAGKTTTLRLILGLTAPSAGSATIAGLPFHRHRRPALLVGAALGADAFHPSWSPRKQLRLMAAAAKIDASRIDQVLARTGLLAEADRPVGGMDLADRRRVALAVALLGDPRVLVLDDPFEGSDDDDRVWLRGLLRSHALAGGAVLMTASGLADVAGIADELLVMERGRIAARGSLEETLRIPDVAEVPVGELVAS